MKKYLIFLIVFFITFSQHNLAQTTNHRLIILADMGNEPDEVQQMVHMMMYSNEFDLEGLIAVTGKFLNPENSDPYRQVLHPELFMEIINGYEKVLENLKKHAPGWPEPDYLRSIVKSGQTGYGIGSTGEGKSSGGSELIVKSLVNPDPRPVYIVVNAGSNTLAQALIDCQSRFSKQKMDEIISKIRVYENGAQDNSGAWICSKFPDIHWIRSNYQTYCYGGPNFESEGKVGGKTENLGPHTWEPYIYSPVGQHQWALENIITGLGNLGAVYPMRLFPNGFIAFIEGGGTIPWLGLVHRGLSSIDHPGWGGWSGRYTSEKVINAYSKHNSVSADERKYDDFALFIDTSDIWTDMETGKKYDNKYAPVWRWRSDYFNDLKCRMDWCIEEYADANHPPIAAFNGDATEKIHAISVNKGEMISLDASASTDPDGDSLGFSWWVYPEAGTYGGDVRIKNSTNSQCSVQVPKNIKNESIHVILEISDENEIAPMKDYRRIILNVK